MPKPLFEFFELVADELSVTASKVITHEDLRIEGKDSPLLGALIKKLKVNNAEETIPLAVTKLQEHFEGKGASLPFEYKSETGRFTAIDSEFLSFVNYMRDIRSSGKRSRDFECVVANRLGRRTTGAIHRVGHPRDKKKSRAAFNQHLETLGFERPVLYGRDKDGGLDILWLLPIGTIPHKPIVSIQCKNGEFNTDEAHKSVGTANGSFARHTGLQQLVYVPCVLFNDYIHIEMLSRRPMGFVPLGLTDLAPLRENILVNCI
jgi:hypothetical protein